MSAVKMGLTIEEAAECTGIGRNTMRKLVEWGKLPVLKVGRKPLRTAAFDFPRTGGAARSGNPERACP